jgi:hypothetical protein
MLANSRIGAKEVVRRTITLLPRAVASARQVAPVSSAPILSAKTSSIQTTVGFFHGLRMPH